MEEHKDFLEAWEQATKPIVEKYNKTLVPAFRFGQEWLPAQLIVQPTNEDGKESKADKPTDKGNKTAKS